MVDFKVDDRLSQRFKKSTTVGCNVAAAGVVQQWSSRTSRDDGDGKTVVGASAGPSFDCGNGTVVRRTASRGWTNVQTAGETLY